MSRQAPVGVGYTHVERLHQLRGAEVAGQAGMEAGPWNVELAVVRRHVCTGALEDLAIAHSPVTNQNLTL